ncbi:MAG: hypothetical protein J6T86_05905 [Bacteroidales bacterium]|nr:hypothetical protein [Bacteroidales bacterium]
MLYVFNPEHDYALANNGPHFVPLDSAVRFARECALFLRFLIHADDCIFLPYHEEMRYMTADGQPADRPPVDTPVRPWGWDPLVLHQLRAEGFCTESRMDGHVQRIRELAHRRTASAAMEYLRDTLPAACQVPLSALEIQTPQEVESFIERHHDVIFKSPYSGNGRGHLYAHGECSPTLLRQITGVIKRQGSIMAEPMYQIFQDFAMEFFCHQQRVSFAGYSLFETQHYGYSGNLLQSNLEIEKQILQHIFIEQLTATRESILSFLQNRIAPYYEGPLGVDMCLYQHPDGVRLNPMIEINLRMTMGLAARMLYDRHVHPEATGVMRIEYRSQGLSDFIQQQKKEHPWESADGRWRSGFRTLTPVGEETQYAVCLWLS